MPLQKGEHAEAARNDTTIRIVNGVIIQQNYQAELPQNWSCFDVSVVFKGAMEMTLNLYPKHKDALVVD